MKVHDIVLPISEKLFWTMGNQNLTIGRAIAEFIDNSIDAKKDTTKVKVVLKEETIVVSDTSSGMDLDGLVQALTPAESRKMMNESVGGYGFGLKTASAFLGRTLEIVTNNSEMESALYVKLENTKELSEYSTENWNIQIKEVPKSFTKGTVLTISNLNRPRYVKDEESVIAHFSKTFSRFIQKEELELEVNTVVVKPYEFEPYWSEEFNFSVTNMSGQICNVSGWVGVSQSLEKSTTSKTDNGFHLYLNGRLLNYSIWIGLDRHPEMRLLVGEIQLQNFKSNVTKTEVISDSQEYIEFEEEFIKWLKKNNIRKLIDSNTKELTKRRRKVNSKDSITPEAKPTSEPGSKVSATPKAEPTSEPGGSKVSATPKAEPTSEPGTKDSITLEVQPTSEPGSKDSITPEAEPTSEPGTKDSITPEAEPTSEPGSKDSITPEAEPTSEPGSKDSITPEAEPTSEPGSKDSITPEAEPTSEPGTKDSITPEVEPTSGQGSKVPVTPKAEPSGEDSKLINVSKPRIIKKNGAQHGDITLNLNTYFNAGDFAHSLDYNNKPLNLVITHLDDSPLNTSTPGEYVLSYTATDEHRQSSSTKIKFKVVDPNNVDSKEVKQNYKMRVNITNFAFTKSEYEKFNFPTGDLSKKINETLIELSNLDFNKNRIAVVALFRVLIELCCRKACEFYADIPYKESNLATNVNNIFNRLKNKLPANNGSSFSGDVPLSDKLAKEFSNFIGFEDLDVAQTGMKKSAVIDLLNLYMHHERRIPDEVINYWDATKPFLIACLMLPNK